MTGAELIKFIQDNALENEIVTIEYFSYAKGVKFCKGCSSLVDLEDYHQGTSGAGPESSSHYRYVCKPCFRKTVDYKKHNATAKNKKNGIRKYLR